MANALGDIIATRRKALGMTQAELAEKMGVTDKAVSKWERNLSCPDVGSLARLAEVLGITLNELMQVEAPKPDDQPDIPALTGTICKAVGLAMGVAVIILSGLNSMDIRQIATMMGMGLTCLGIAALQKK